MIVDGWCRGFATGLASLTRQRRGFHCDGAGAEASRFAASCFCLSRRVEVSTLDLPRLTVALLAAFGAVSGPSPRPARREIRRSRRTVSAARETRDEKK